MYTHLYIHIYHIYICVLTSCLAFCLLVLIRKEPRKASKKVNEGMLGIFLRGECLGPGTAGLMDEG